MKNLFYGALVLGVIAIALGIYFFTGNHHILPYAGIGVGIVLLIIGIYGAFIAKPREV